MTMFRALALGFLFVRVAAAGAAPADYACVIEPWQVLKLAAPVQGVVVSVAVDRGDLVHKGDVLARLDSDVEQANAEIAKVRASNDTALTSAHAKLDFLSHESWRNDQLRRTNMVSLSKAEQTESDAKTTAAQLREAELNLAQARLEAQRAEAILRQRMIVSPVDGVVTERALGPGEFRNDQAHVLTVAELDRLRVEAYLPIALFGQVSVGDTATVLPEAPVGGSYTATVTVVDRVFEAASGTVGVRLELPNPGLLLPAGLHCRVMFKTPETAR